jgi:hypothetical protein
MIRETLKELFSGAVPVIISDSPQVGSWAQTHGMGHLNIEEATSKAPSEAFVVVTSDEWYSRIDSLYPFFSDSRSLWLPLAAFDGGPSAVSYGLRHLESIDFHKLEEGHQAAFNLIQASENLRFRGLTSDTDLRIHFAGEVEFNMLADLTVPRNSISSMQSFLEFEYEQDEHEIASGIASNIRSDGTIIADGILAAYGPGVFSADDDVARHARQMVAEAGTRTTKILVSESSIERIYVGSLDATETFQSLAGPCGLHISEFSLGFYVPEPGSVDWTVNSPFNEGIQGVHIGIGDGYSGMHFDFVTTNLRIS